MREGQCLLSPHCRPITRQNAAPERQRQLSENCNAAFWLPASDSSGPKGELCKVRYLRIAAIGSDRKLTQKGYLAEPAISPAQRVSKLTIWDVFLLCAATIQRGSAWVPSHPNFKVLGAFTA